MSSPFVRFSVIFISIVLAASGAYFLWRHRPAPVPPTAAVVETAPIVPPAAAPAPAATPPQMPEPPDVNGLDFSEVSIPGIKLDAQAPVSPAPVTGDYVAELTRRALVMPTAGLRLKDLSDTFHDKRGAGEHEAIDIMEPKGTPVRAIDQGNIVKLFTSQRGGLTIYQFDDSRRYCYYYAHLDRYADGIKEGALVRAGDVIGYVGMSGNAPAPHLHFALSRVGPDQKWWTSAPLDPYPVLVRLVR